jgi:integrase
LKELALIVLGRKEKEEVKKETLLEIAQRYATASNLRSDSSGDSIKDSTQTGYKTFYHKLLEYQKARRIKLDYKSINRKFYFDFVSYWEEKGYKPNTIGSYIKRLKSLMKAAEELGYHNNREYTKPYFKKFTESVDNVYMTEEELIAISKLELELDSRLDRARDWFLIGCKTGLRISDLKALSKSNISKLGEKRFINIRNQKTKNKVSIPISSLLNDILAKRDYHFPEFMSDQKFNDYIKEVGRLAGIDSECEIKQHKNTKHELDKGPKYLMMSSHTGRRTFCTNAYLAGISESWIMQISGHTSYNSFKEYIKADHLERAILLADHPFFG